MSKTEKLIMRGSENPEVARAAKTISDMLCRLALGQVQYFAESVQAAFPNLTPEEAIALSKTFERTAEYFRQIAQGEQFPHVGYQNEQVRPWASEPEFFYNIHKVFCVLACDLEHCEENLDCWETRSAFCRDDANRRRA